MLWLAFNVKQNDLVAILGDKYFAFREWMLSKDVPMFESLSRARRKVQEKNEHLRGESYKKRIEEADLVKQWSLDT